MPSGSGIATTAAPATATTAATASPADTGPAVTASPALAATPSPAPTAPPSALTGLVPGALAITVSDGLRVRSAPRIAADSLKYTPLLPLGSQLVVIGGPVRADDYAWYLVSPLGVKLSGDADQGWVAIANRDGTPWVALAKDPTPGYELAVATVERAPAKVAAAKAQAASVNAFGIALYKRMLKDKALGLSKKGVVFSPTSIAIALAMARAGAAGNTAAEMDALLRVKDWNQLGAGISSLSQLLASRDASWQDEEQQQHTLSLRIANMVFAQRGLGIERTYLERIGRTFGAGLGQVDYTGNLEGAIKAINGWVSQQTVGRIPKLLGPTDVTNGTRVVLVNTVYLKANWSREFEDGATTARTFTTLDGKHVSPQTMTLDGEQDVALAKGPGWRATELRYMGADGTSPLAMTLILPDNLPAYEAALTPAALDAVQARIRAEQKRLATTTDVNYGDMSCPTYPYSVRLYLPRFGIDTRASLVPVLRQMGLRLATEADGADFSGMATPSQLFIAAVIHQANIDVDEKGTEARPPPRYPWTQRAVAALPAP